MLLICKLDLQGLPPCSNPEGLVGTAGSLDDTSEALSCLNPSRALCRDFSCRKRSMTRAYPKTALRTGPLCLESEGKHSTKVAIDQAQSSFSAPKVPRATSQRAPSCLHRAQSSLASLELETTTLTATCENDQLGRLKVAQSAELEQSLRTSDMKSMKHGMDVITLCMGRHPHSLNADGSLIISKSAAKLDAAG